MHHSEITGEEENDNQFNILKNEKDLNNFKILEDFILISSDNRNFDIGTNNVNYQTKVANYEIKFNLQ